MHGPLSSLQTTQPLEGALPISPDHMSPLFVTGSFPFSLLLAHPLGSSSHLPTVHVKSNPTPLGFGPQLTVAAVRCPPLVHIRTGGSFSRLASLGSDQVLFLSEVCLLFLLICYSEDAQRAHLPAQRPELISLRCTHVS